MSKFKMGDRVAWSTWGRGNPRKAIHHEGSVFTVVPAGRLPWQINPICRGVAATAVPRREESYVIYEYTKLYWPRTKTLFVAPPEAKAKP